MISRGTFPLDPLPCFHTWALVNTLDFKSQFQKVNRKWFKTGPSGRFKGNRYSLMFNENYSPVPSVRPYGPYEVYVFGKGMWRTDQGNGGLLMLQSIIVFPNVAFVLSRQYNEPSWLQDWSELERSGCEVFLADELGCLGAASSSWHKVFPVIKEQKKKLSSLPIFGIHFTKIQHTDWWGPSVG